LQKKNIKNIPRIKTRNQINEKNGLIAQHISRSMHEKRFFLNWLKASINNKVKVDFVFRTAFGWFFWSDQEHSDPHIVQVSLSACRDVVSPNLCCVENKIWYLDQE